MSAQITVTHFSDPGCPWAYSAAPYLTALRWRYGDQLDWRLRMIGLAEDPQRYVDRGYTPTRMAQTNRRFRGRGMPFATQPRERVAATGRACRTVVAARLLAPGREDEVFRALQLAQFTTTLIFDVDADIRTALQHVPGLDADALVRALDSDEVEAAYQADRAAARSAHGGPTEFQGKAANSDGEVRFTAPSLVFTHADGRSLEAGGFQPLEAYDVCIANLDTSLERRGPAEDPAEALAAFPHPLTTREVAVLMARHLTDADDVAAEEALIEAAGDGRAVREGVGNSALWVLAQRGGELSARAA